MANERNNTALEFETMLRRHLKSGGAPVAACIGFDLDAASAYLEDALGGAIRARFEGHLAGCAACRRHLIELARLPQLTPRPVAGQTPVWVRWREAAAGWLDFPAWDWKWQTIGAAGAAFAVLIAVLSVQAWQQASKPAADAVALNSATQASPAAMPQVVAPEPTPDVPPDAASASFSDQPRRQPGAEPPKPPNIGPKAQERELAVLPSGRSFNLPAGQTTGSFQFEFRSQPPVAPAEVSSRNFLTMTGIGASSQAPPPIVVSDAQQSEKQLAAKLVARQQEEVLASSEGGPTGNVTARLTSPPENNPMDSVAKPRRTRAEKAESQSSRSSLLSRAMSLMPMSKSESERKAKGKIDDDESFKPITVRIRDKVFRFERQMWIDQDYKPEMSRWRVRKLVIGSQEYDQVLANDPQLKEFFDHGPIIVVWKDKIYKVTGQ